MPEKRHNYNKISRLMLTGLQMTTLYQTAAAVSQKQRSVLLFSHSPNLSDITQTRTTHK